MTGNPERYDFVVAAVFGAFALLVCGAYLVRVAARGPARFDRVETDGGSWIFHKRLMAVGYWAIMPVGRVLAWAGVKPDHLTWTSVLIGLFSGVAFAQGQFGAAAVLALFAGLMDALDGMVGRMTGTTSSAGTVLDSAADRYVEFFWFTGLAICFRGDLLMLGAALLALHGSFMVSYSTAKAQSSETPVPRGIMRRPERVFLLLMGSMISAVMRDDTAVRLTVGFIAVIANISAIRRLGAIRGVLRDRDEQRLS